MKLLLFSDLHLDAQFSWLGVDSQAASGRRQALRQTLLNITRLARDLAADALLCGGDLYEHERASPDTAAFLRATFASLHPLPVYITPGNHDWFGPRSIYAQTEWSENVRIFSSAALTPATLHDGVTLWGAAHHGPATATGFLEGFSVPEPRDGIHVALFHGSEQGWTAGREGQDVYAPFAPHDVLRAGLRHAFLGHFHAPREAETHTYPGNPDPLSFGESGTRGAVEIDLHADGTIARRWHSVSQTSLKDVAVSVTDCASQHDVRARIADAVGTAPCFARVTLTGDLDPAVDLNLRELSDAAPWLHALVLRTEAVHPKYDLEALAAERTIRGEFVRDVRATISDPDEQRRVLVTGLRALAGRDDLEVI